MALPPGTFSLPLIGDTLNFLQDSQFAKKRHQQYGPIFKTSIFGQPTVFVSGSEANLFVLSHENQYFVMSWPPSMKALLGPLSLALQTGSEHQNRRKLLYQAFQPRALAGYIGGMEDITGRYLERWTQMSEFAWYPELRNYTFDVASKLLVGIDAGSETALGHYFETWCEGLFSIALDVPWTKFGKAKKCRKLLLSELEKIIRDRQQDMGEGNDALSLLISARDDDGNNLSLEELKDQVLLLLFAGHETLTSAIASFCLLLAQNPDVMAKVRAEQQQFSATEPLDLEQLKQMTYLEQVMREVLRLVPPVGGGFRRVIQACEFGGYEIPQGWSVLYEINQTHQDSSVYPEPDRFDPDRFSLERSTNAKPFSYVPFGGGLRECLGKEFARLEMKLFAARMVRECEWDLLPDQDLNLIRVPTPHPRDGLRVKFRQKIAGS
ncbi:MAG: cytochrome P450 [Microcoleus sp. PH2017_29_MFU_D_A]|jgi:retinoid hydroxylase|uniref:cytochrome P450 n=1 Tax=unclassified Microcoleus TaxID=2642155 RepID=UPI001DF87A74|nr:MULTISPECIES: cytochrome P450 [unclassified Microcoleus]MCC3508106.1 cytochrome P450 [Microcoleus sp. PH2017_17_BER_D_A]MCC3423387.1 cytochrome P450 [Microcoleus sp. PH2017_01_SCD_O_A]MCC3498054.1 cytochrome P450 [Microcoleus sp. PH2017_15_JOR_U_A]MCC3585511.1 cytochrome P450 [Microcoleus sp. PH2017_30_WIL_O_A]MCC3591554.1 cytochrome P450 [Microcoleus sp. PH2017_28_MFU_U_A]